MIWADVRETTGRLVALQSDLSAALAELGFAPERRAYKPHVTLARFRGVSGGEAIRNAAARFERTDFGVADAAEVVVYASELTPDGPVYTQIAKAPLGSR